MATFEDVRSHLDSFLTSPSSDEVISYLAQWARPGQELRLLLGHDHVQYPSLADLGGRRDSNAGIPMPWRFRSAEAADQFCALVESAFQAARSRCRIEGRASPD